MRILGSPCPRFRLSQITRGSSRYVLGSQTRFVTESVVALGSIFFSHETLSFSSLPVALSQITRWHYRYVLVRRFVAESVAFYPRVLHSLAKQGSRSGGVDYRCAFPLHRLPKLSLLLN